MKNRSYCSTGNNLLTALELNEDTIEYEDLHVGTISLMSLGRQASVAVLPPRCGPLSPGSIPSPGAVCPFGFQSKLESAGFSPDTPVFLLHMKLGFLNKSISGNIVWSYSASADWLLMALRLGTLTFLG